jgi:hypothetical protein
MYVVPLALFIGCIAPPDDADDKAERGVHKSATQQWKETVAKLPPGVTIAKERYVRTTVTYPDWGFDKSRFRIRITTVDGGFVWAGRLAFMDRLGTLRVNPDVDEVDVLLVVPGERHQTVRVPVVDGKVNISTLGGAK